MVVCHAAAGRGGQQHQGGYKEAIEGHPDGLPQVPGF